MKSHFTLFFIYTCLWATAQTTATFENYNLTPGQYLNNSAPAAGFESGHIFLPNTNFGSFWSGWTISASTDNTTAGFTNDYSAITGSGVNGSNTYAIAYAGFGSVMHLTDEAKGGIVEGFYITNSTYAYLSMLDGDAFAKKFGGEDGNDPDFFLLTIKKYLDGQLSTDSIDFYLADFRSSDNTQDYIVNEWTYLDLSTLGGADSLWFSLSSSDVGIFGINTPTYFAIDDVTTSDASDTKNLEGLQVEIYPNPAQSFLMVESQDLKNTSYSIVDVNGKNVQSGRFWDFHNKIDLLPELHGAYLLIIEKNGRQLVKTLKLI